MKRWGGISVAVFHWKLLISITGVAHYLYISTQYLVLSKEMSKFNKKELRLKTKTAKEVPPN
jgi:hypothetical protein